MFYLFLHVTDDGGCTIPVPASGIRGYVHVLVGWSRNPQLHMALPDVHTRGLLWFILGMCKFIYPVYMP